MTIATLLIASALGFRSDDPSRSSIEPVGQFRAQPLAEVSGIIASRKTPGRFWVHNDSGNRATIFAVRRDGELVASHPVQAPNVDWEDIATDDRGRLYLADTGNNGLRLAFRAIHRIVEPDAVAQNDSPVTVEQSFYFRYPGNQRFDCESLVVFRDHAYLISKRLDGKPAEIFRFPLDRPATLFKMAELKKVGTLDGFHEPATGADLSRDGRKLAVVSLGATRIYEWSERGPGRRLATFTYPPRQYESICWDGDDLLIASEDRRIDRIRTSPAGGEAGAGRRPSR